ncbi:hypothetical protein [Nitrosovibrio sp. Nv6]|uniref:hypothetical protein n=1 Tax=Nitrosovibrio sp. Nv6 TaxID=1855340 RepID=UPI0015A57A85|nr:hypothetical protein [Nitrosovibrio sp. Nv6]
MFAGVLEQAPEPDELVAAGRGGGQSRKPHAVGVVAGQGSVSKHQGSVLPAGGSC